MECKAAGKQLLVWTVNEPDHMMEVSILLIGNIECVN